MIIASARKGHSGDIHSDLCVGAELEKKCNQMMMVKFGRLVDLAVLQTLSGNIKLEELKQDKLLREAGYAKELKEWDVS